MNLHTADLTSRLSDYLARRTPPRGIAHDEMLKSDQMQEYLRILRRFAPEGEKLAGWWRAFTDKLADDADTWAWPSPKEVARAAKASAQDVGGQASEWRPDSVAINLSRLNEGKPIGEDWLWGEGAMRLERAGASPVVLRERRIQMAKQMEEIYPKEAVRQRLLELKARHEDARNRKPSERRQYDTTIPGKQPFSDAELQDLVA